MGGEALKMATAGIDVTDVNGVRVQGFVQTFRPTDPTDPLYGFARGMRHEFFFFDTNAVCTIDQDALRNELRASLVEALEAAGISNPASAVVAQNVDDYIRLAREQCTPNKDSYVSNEIS